jgi:hypothetical protein
VPKDRIMTNRSNKLPDYVKDCLRNTANSIGAALDFLEWPNGGVDAHPDEHNVTAYLQACMSHLEPSFHFYSEARIGEKNGRLDLLASNGELSLAIEAKGFGNISNQSSQLINDVERLLNFSPSCFKAEGFTNRQWWETSSQRWGLALILSFRGSDLQEAWCMDDDGAAMAALRKRRWGSDPESPFMKLRGLNWTERFAHKIQMDDRWRTTTADGWLLCGAVALS